MIRHQEECKVDYNEQMKGGKGTVEVRHFISGPEELNGKGRLFAQLTLNPGCSIGYHMHEGDSEIFYILEGTAQYNDDGVVKTVVPGDVAFCAAGHCHGIANEGTEVVRLIAVIPYA
jgi:quercetin dioxygenase-like cupin family protein